MARIIAGLAASHTPIIGFAKDTKTRDDPAWADVFRVFEPLTRWLDEKRIAQVVVAREIGEPHGGTEWLELHGCRVERRVLGDLDRDAPDGAVGDRGVVPSRASSIGTDATEPAVHPRHRRGVDPVPAPDVERAPAPGALCEVRRAMTGHPYDATEEVWQRFAVGTPEGTSRRTGSSRRFVTSVRHVGSSRRVRSVGT